MLDWVQVEITRWKNYLNSVDDHSQIPWQLQPGKLLAKYDGDVDQAIKIAKYQGSQDEQSPTLFAEDRYWLNVINYLTQKRVNDLILGE